MIWRGLGQKREKNLNGYSPGEKKLNSITRKKKKLNSTTWKKIHQQVGQEKKTHQPVGQEKKNSLASWPGKKTLHEFSAQGPPRSLMVRP